MSKANKYLIAALAASQLSTVSAYAGDDDIKDKFNPILTAVTSQSIAVDARAAAMGDLGAATDPDVNSQSWNPAKYPFTISRAGLALNYTPWLRQLVNDIALLNATGYMRIGDYQAISGSLRYFSLGDVTAGTMQVNPTNLALTWPIRECSLRNFQLPWRSATCIPTSLDTTTTTRPPVQPSLPTSPVSITTTS